MRYPYIRFFNPAHWMQMLHDDGIVSAHHSCQYSRVRWCGSLWINVFKWSSSNPVSLPEHGVSLMSIPLLQTRKPFSCHALPDGIVPVHGANVSGHLHCFHPSIELKEKNMSVMFQFLHLALHFLASTAPLTIFKWKTSIFKLKHNNWTSNKKWQLMNKPIAIRIPPRETKLLWN